MVSLFDHVSGEERTVGDLGFGGVLALTPSSGIVGDPIFWERFKGFFRAMPMGVVDLLGHRCGYLLHARALGENVAVSMVALLPLLGASLWSFNSTWCRFDIFGGKLWLCLFSFVYL
jgi:hypothetical protein